MLSKEKQVDQTQLAVHYEMTSDVVDGGEDMEYTTYGIKAVDENTEVVAHYRDVSTNMDFVRQIIEKCNQYQVDVLHLEDIILDSIG